MGRKIRRPAIGKTKAVPQESLYKDIPEYKDFRESQRAAESAARLAHVTFKDLRGPEKVKYESCRDLWFRAKAALQPKKTSSSVAYAAEAKVAPSAAPASVPVKPAPKM
jgi:hypothetical protein